MAVSNRGKVILCKIIDNKRDHKQKHAEITASINQNHWTAYYNLAKIGFIDPPVAMTLYQIQIANSQLDNF